MSFFKKRNKQEADDKIIQSIEQLASNESVPEMFHLQDELHPMPSAEKVNQLLSLLRSLFFPGYFGPVDAYDGKSNAFIEDSVRQIHTLLRQQLMAGLCFNHSRQLNESGEQNDNEEIIAENFIARLPYLRQLLHRDVLASYNGDPAAKSVGEVIFCYPGIRAIISYRVAHELLLLGVPILPRLITELAHSETGIDIHPGASIGHSFMIDHGTGVVIGETARIGDNVRIYQGVTLGAKSFPLDSDGNPIKGIDRHPKIGNNVIIYSNSTILGNILIGNDAVIGGNIWVDTDVPAGTKLLQMKSVEELKEKKRKKKEKKEKKHKKNKFRTELAEADHSEMELDDEAFLVDRHFEEITNKPIPPFKICKGCKSKNGCSKCRARYEKKYSVLIK